MQDEMFPQFMELKEKKKEEIHQNRIKSDEFVQRFGDILDVGILRKLNTRLQEDADQRSLFFNRYQEEIPQEDIAQEQDTEVRTEITTNVKRVVGDREISDADMGLRITSTKQRMELQRILVEQQQAFFGRKVQEYLYAQKYMSRDQAEILSERFKSADINENKEEQKEKAEEQKEKVEEKSEEQKQKEKKEKEQKEKSAAEREALREWMVAEGESEAGLEMTDKYMEELASEQDEKHYGAMLKIVKFIPKLIDPGKFVYKGDKEFAAGFAYNYSLISRGAAAKVFLDRLDNAAKEGLYELKDDLEQARQIIGLCTGLKAEYEERMELISSPYYALLSQDDLNAYLGENGEQRLKDLSGEGWNKDAFVAYINRYRKLSASQLSDNIREFKNAELEKHKTVKLSTVEGKEITEKAQDVDTDQMKKFSKCMKDLTLFLGQRMPALDADPEQLDASCVIAATLYNNVMGSIQNCLKKTENYGNRPSIERRLREVYNQCKLESSLFRTKAMEYRELIAEGGYKKDTVLTWSDALRYQRAVVYNLDGQDGVSMKKFGNSSSVVYRLTTQKNGEKNHVFFRKNERVWKKGIVNVADSYYNALSEENKRKYKDIFDAIKIDSVKIVKGQYFQDFIEDMRLKSEVDILNELLNTGGLTVQRKLSEFRQANPGGLKKLGMILKDLSKKCFQTTIATSSRGGAYISSGNSLSQRNVATSRMAQLLGVQDMIADSRTAYVRRGKELIQGNIMEDTKGMDEEALNEKLEKDKKTAYYDAAAINQLFSLQIFDIICGQVDRNAANFHLLTKQNGSKEVKITGIKGLDNDLSFGKLLFRNIERGYNRIREASEENLRGMPLQLLNSIMHLRPRDMVLDHMLCDILTEHERAALWDRIMGLQDRIRNLPGLVQDDYGRFQYEDEEDNNDTLRQAKVLREMKRKWLRGETQKMDYISVFRSDYVNMSKLDEVINNGGRVA